MNEQCNTAKKPFEKTRLPNIKNILIVASGKGGVGKSTVAAGLAHAGGGGHGRMAAPPQRCLICS